MASLSFPDINVWLSVLMADHVHRQVARRWWEDSSDSLAFVRLTQVGVLRLLTTSAAMNGQPLTMRQAWSAYDRLFLDERVVFFDDPRGIEVDLRHQTQDERASPKLWADAWLQAVAGSSGGRIVTFDRALSQRASGAVLLC